MFLPRSSMLLEMLKRLDFRRMTSRRHVYTPPSLTTTLGKSSGERKSSGLSGLGERIRSNSTPFLYQAIATSDVVDISPSVKLHVITTWELCSTVLFSETEIMGSSATEIQKMPK